MTPRSRPSFRTPQSPAPMVGFSQQLPLNTQMVDPGWMLPPCTPHSYPRLSLTSSSPHCTPVSPACHFRGLPGMTGLRHDGSECTLLCLPVHPISHSWILAVRASWLGWGAVPACGALRCSVQSGKSVGPGLGQIWIPVLALPPSCC